jgi:hypothetical protein
MARNGRQLIDRTQPPPSRHALRTMLLVLFCIAPMLGFASLLFDLGLWNVRGFYGWFTLSVAALGGWTLTSLIVAEGRDRIDWFPLILVAMVTSLWIYIHVGHPFG